ncbi:MAG: hypothetical protein V4501_10160 [Pseudomonadota bacterium]
MLTREEEQQATFDTQLLLAAQHNDWQFVRDHLSQVRNIEINSLFDTQVLIAARNSDWGFVTDCLAHVKNINVTFTDEADEGKTILWFAAKARQWELVKTILQCPGINVAAQQKNPSSGSYSLAYIDFYFDDMTDLNQNSAYDDLYRNVVWFALKDQQIEIVESLLRTGQTSLSDCVGLTKEVQLIYTDLENIINNKFFMGSVCLAYAQAVVSTLLPGGTSTILLSFMKPIEVSRLGDTCSTFLKAGKANYAQFFVGNPNQTILKIAEKQRRAHINDGIPSLKNIFRVGNRK